MQRTSFAASDHQETPTAKWVTLVDAIMKGRDDEANASWPPAESSGAWPARRVRSAGHDHGQDHDCLGGSGEPGPAWWFGADSRYGEPRRLRRRRLWRICSGQVDGRQQPGKTDRAQSGEVPGRDRGSRRVRADGHRLSRSARDDLPQRQQRMPRTKCRSHRRPSTRRPRS